MNQIDNAIGEIGREVRTEVNASVLAQAAGHINSRETLSEGQLDVGVSLVVAQQDVEARLLLLDEVILERERLFVIGDNDVVDIDRLADERAGLRVFPTAFVKIRRNPRAQVLALPT